MMLMLRRLGTQKWRCCFSFLCLSHGCVSHIIRPTGHSFMLLTVDTQVPSSINRAYSLVYPDLVSLPFTYASGIVLPLMGFWNSVIYITTSWPAVRGLFSTSNYGVRRSSLVFNRRPSVGIRKWTGSESDSVKRLSPIWKRSGYDQV